MSLARISLCLALAVVLGCNAIASRRTILFSEPPVLGDFESLYLLTRDNPQRAGSAFLVVHSGRQYLVTSKSIALGLYPNRVDIRTTTSKVTAPIRRMWVSPSTDIGVVILDQVLPHNAGATTPLATNDEFNLSTEAWTLGFPANQSVLSGMTRPAPLIGHAYFAGLVSDGLMAFDGRAYPGAIGGPIYMRNREGALRIAAVISSSPGSRIQGATTDSLLERTNVMLATPIAGLTSVLDSLTDAPLDQ